MQSTRLNSNEDDDIEETKIFTTTRVLQKKTSNSSNQSIVTNEKLKVTKLRPSEYLKMKKRRAELASKDKPTKKGRGKRGGSILCWGAFVTGPSYDKMLSLIVISLVLMAMSTVSYIFVRELQSPEKSTPLVLYLVCSFLFGMGTFVSQLCAQLSDPGIHMPIGSQRDSNLNAYCLYLNEEEASKFHDDPIYQNSMFYQFRGCSTCLIDRPPKSSHCN